MRFEEAGSLRDLITTVEEMEQKQKMAAAEGDNIDIFAYYAEPPLIAVNLFHLRNGRIVDRREYLLGRSAGFRSAGVFLGASEAGLPEPAVHSGASSMCRWSLKIVEVLEEFLSEKRGRKVEIHTPQRGQKKAMLGSGGDQREAQFRFALPRDEAVVGRDSGSPAGCAESAGSAETHRMLRHLAHPGHR